MRPGRKQPEDDRTSVERSEDVVFEGLMKRWTQAREWDWLKGAQIMYGHVLEERERLRAEQAQRDADWREYEKAGKPVKAIEGVVVEGPLFEVDEHGKRVPAGEPEDEKDEEPDETEPGRGGTAEVGALAGGPAEVRRPVQDARPDRGRG